MQRNRAYRLYILVRSANLSPLSNSKLNAYFPNQFSTPLPPDLYQNHTPTFSNNITIQESKGQKQMVKTCTNIKGKVQESGS